jgi:rhodanese-related sulfurtransferase
MPKSSYPEDLEALVKECEELFPDSPWLHVDEYLSRRSEQWLIIDVRNQEEREVSMLPGAISFEDFLMRQDGHQRRPLLLYCTIGCRSGSCVEDLLEDGFEAYNLWGGVLAWAHHGQVFINPEGEETVRVHVFAPKWNVLPAGYCGES